MIDRPGSIRFPLLLVVRRARRRPSTSLAGNRDAQPDDVNPTRALPHLLTLLCWLPALPAAAGQGVELTPAERDWLAAHPRILLGSDAHWRPYVWRQDDGTPAGIETDLIARINALTGANIELVLGDWSEIVERARRGELHGLAVSASHPERADRFLFSASPYSTHKFIFTRQHSPITRMEDLAGRRVGVLRDNLAELKLLQRWPDIRPVEIDTPLDMAVDLQNGDLDAAIASANLLWAVNENLLPDLRLAFPVPGSKIDLRYSIGKEHAPLLGIIDMALAAIEPAEVMAILRKWDAEQRPNIALSADERAWLTEKHSVRVRIGDHPPGRSTGPRPRAWRWITCGSSASCSRSISASCLPRTPGPRDSRIWPGRTGSTTCCPPPNGPTRGWPRWP